MSMYSAELCTAKVGEEAISLCYMLRSLGFPVNGPMLLAYWGQSGFSNECNGNWISMQEEAQ